MWIGEGKQYYYVDLPSFLKGYNMSVNEKIEELNKVTNNCAEILRLISSHMEGRGILAREAPFVQSKLLEVEQKLRQVGSKDNMLVPDNTEIKPVVW